MSLRAMPVEVAIVDATTNQSLPWAQVDAVARAINAQVQGEFRDVWHVRASVVATQAPGEHQWQVRLCDDVQDALGYHTDANGQPYALVDAVNAGAWSVTTSHEVLEMAADPWGSRMHQARVPKGVDWQAIGGLKHESSRVSYLVEVCDPPEAERYAYEVAGVQVSSFLKPAWYRTTAVNVLGAYDYPGSIPGPRTLLPGGYVSFMAPGGEWYQAFADSRGRVRLYDLGRFDRAEYGSLRVFADAKARELRPLGADT